MTNKLLVHAPFGGWVRTLEGLPDPVFAERMAGDGIAIDPLERLVVAPFDGFVISVAKTNHAITLRSQNGIDVLIHIGIDSVKLGGQGFEALVQTGQRVARGEGLIAFDLNAIAERVPCLATPVLMPNENAQVRVLAELGPIAAGAPLFEVELLETSKSVPTATGLGGARCVVVLPLAEGIHARPAARLSKAARDFASDLSFAVGEKHADAKSMVSLLSLGATQGDEIEISAKGPDARQAVVALSDLIEHGLHEKVADEQPATIVSETTAAALRQGRIAGVAASPGLAVGTAYHIGSADLEIVATGQGVLIEADRLARAKVQIAEAINARTIGHGSVAADIGEAHIALLNDAELDRTAKAEITKGASAEAAWRKACRAQEKVLLSLGTPRLAERVVDVRDIERQILACLAGHGDSDAPRLPAGHHVIIADDLLPSEFLQLDRSRLAAIALARGGRTSHVAILAASAGIPLLVSLGKDLAGIAAGAELVVNADQSWLDTAPLATELADFRTQINMLADQQAELIDAAQADLRLACGKRIEIFANLASVEDADQAVAMGAEGCGLLRTEFLFLERPKAPDESEQAGVYSSIAKALGDRPLIVRTLDVGGDKHVPYLPFPHEDNPALGMRGVRFSLQRPDLLEQQLRAILAAVPASQCRIMLPMVVDGEEVKAVRVLLDRLCNELSYAASVQLGVMIETPAAALMANELCEVADFLSIGSNDLTQYVLAMDRGNDRLAAQADGAHPAVIRMMAKVAEVANAAGKWVGICGGLASDPAMAPLLVGLGLDELSATAATIPAVKTRLRTVSIEQCREVAKAALACGSASEVRQLIGGLS